MNVQYLIDEFIENNKDEKKAEFDKGLITSKYPIKGIKTSLLENFAKKLAKNNINIKDIQLDCHEKIVIAGMVIGYKKYDNKDKIRDLEYLIPFIDNWGSCDMIVPRLKGLENEREFFEKLLTNNYPFAKRIGIVWLMKFCLKNDLRNVVNKLKTVYDSNYYVQMALGWCYAEAFLYDFDYMYNFIITLSQKFVIAKTLQKVCESLRVTKDQKIKIKNLRKLTQSKTSEL